MQTFGYINDILYFSNSTYSTPFFRLVGVERIIFFFVFLAYRCHSFVILKFSDKNTQNILPYSTFFPKFVLIMYSFTLSEAEVRKIEAET